MDDQIYREIKHLTSLLYSMTNSLFPDEFKNVYKASPNKFREWMNQKTGLDIDHRLDKLAAIKKWLDAMETIKHERDNK